MSDPIERLLAIQTAARRGGASTEVLSWLDRGIERYLSSRGCTLEEALNLNGAIGTRTARTTWLTMQRNRHLKQAHALMPASSPWRRSVSLAEEIKRFLALVWPRWRELDDPPSGTSRLRFHLFMANKSGPIPSGVRRIHDIVTQSIRGFDCAADDRYSRGRVGTPALPSRPFTSTS